MALYETYLDAKHREKVTMDEYAESDPEAYAETDAETDADPDEATPHENGDWYPDWLGIDGDTVTIRDRL